MHPAIAITDPRDVHGFNNRKFNTRYTIVFAKANTTDGIQEVFKKQLSIPAVGNNGPHPNTVSMREKTNI